MEDVLPYLFLLVFPLMWIGASLLLSRLGGWARLAKHFPDAPDAVGTIYRFRSCAIGMANYGNCVNLRVCERGLRLSVLFLLRIGHPPLFIPWEQFHSLNEKRFLFFRTLETYIGMPVIACVILPYWVREHIEAKRNTE